MSGDNSQIGRRTVLKTGAAAGAAAALSGCVGGISGGGGGSEGINIPEDPDGTVDGRTVTLAMDGGQNTLPARWSQDEIKSQTGVGLGEITGFPFSGLYDKLMTEFTSKSDAFDMVGFYPQMLGTFAANGHITPLDELMEIEGWDTAFDGVLKPFQQILTQWDGSTYALPFDGDVLMLVYRRDLFDKHDIKVPETWAEFNEAARYFSEETDDIEHGVATYGKRGFSYGWFLTRFGGAGGVYFDEDMNPQINTEAGRRALESWQETIQYAPDETSSYGYVGLRDAFLKGQCAMVIQWTDVPKKAATSEVKGKWGGAPVPGFSDAGAASAMPVSRVLGIPSYVSDEQKLAAFRFIQTLTSPDYSKHYVSDPACGQDPFHAAHFENPGIFTEPDPLRDADEAEETAFDSMESAEQYTNAVDQTLQQGYPEPYWPGAKQYINALDIEMSRFVAGQVGVEEALSNVESEWESIVEDLGRESQREAYQNVISAWQNAGLWN